MSSIFSLMCPTCLFTFSFSPGWLLLAYLLDIVVAEGAAIFELLAGEDQSLLVGRDAFLVLDLGLDIVDGVRGLHLEGDSLARKGLYEADSRNFRQSFFSPSTSFSNPCGNISKDCHFARKEVELGWGWKKTYICTARINVSIISINRIKGVKLTLYSIFRALLGVQINQTVEGGSERHSEDICVIAKNAKIRNWLNLKGKGQGCSLETSRSI